ncbi:MULTISPECIES: hypothetical protein [Streptomyces]|nr:hypothetical protein [Streptomyces canarius]
MTVALEQDAPAVRDTGGSVLEGLERDAGTAVPRHPGAEPDNDEVLPYRDWEGGFLDETTLICSTVEGDEEWGRHRLLGTAGARTPVEVGGVSRGGSRRL